MAMEQRGLAKLVEECGELIQDAAKLMAYPSGTHPDGGKDLYLRLEDELADVMGACRFVMGKLVLNQPAIEDRAEFKYQRFVRWDNEEQPNG